MSQLIYIVVGASRGIGQELVEQLSKDSSNHVIATTRKPVNYEKSNVQNVILEQTDSQSVKAAAAKVKEADVLIVNAAIGEQEYLLSTSEDRLRQYLETNVLGVHRVIDAFVPALKARSTKKIVVMSSTAASMTLQKDMSFAFQGPYSVTKAANNMQVVQYHNELKNEGFIVIPLHPGWVATDMGNAVIDMDKVDFKPISAAESASGIIKVTQGLKKEDSGKFFQHDGSRMEW